MTKIDLQIYPSCCALHGESTLWSVRWRHVVFESRAFCFTAFVWQVTVMQYIIQNNKNHWNHIPKMPLAWKKLPKKAHFAHIGNEIKICSQNKCHHHLSNVWENSFRMFHSNWVISDYHSFVWQFEFPWLNLTNCPNKWMVIRNDPVPVKHTKWIFSDVGKVMMAFILATDFDFIAYMSKMAFFFLKLFSRQWRFWNMIIISSLDQISSYLLDAPQWWKCIL